MKVILVGFGIFLMVTAFAFAGLFNLPFTETIFFAMLVGGTILVIGGIK